ncbi:MAG: TonB-dependent receptor [Mariniphaga sp.]|nr:TonB-dependent receptor [Mariniphaga sp.]
MKKIKLIDDWDYSCLKKTFRIMRITLFLSLTVILQTFANDSYSQKTRLSLDYSNTRLEVVLDDIESLSEFYFLANEKLVDLNRGVTLTVKNKKIDEILDMLFTGTDVVYTITDRKIILAPSFLTEVAQQQQRSISGKVTDAYGQVLPGVTVVVKGTTQGTVTQADGNYTLANIPEDATLVFSFVGMRTQEIAVRGMTTVHVSLEEETIDIDEVVAVGYGTMKKSDLTGSITSVSSDELAAFPALGIAQAIQGRASGVQITSVNGEPGAGSRIRIRGGTSLNASSDPLYVVDGFAGGAVPPPEDIESIEILKDASATAIYGSRGANGVILITTKSGKKGDTQIEFNSSYSVNQVSKTIDLLNGAEFAAFINEVYENSGNPKIPYPDPQSYGEGTDWQDLVFRKGSLQNYKLSASGGKENFRFYTSLNYFDQDGIIINSDYKRYSGLSNLDFEAGKNLRIGTKMFFQRVAQSGVKSQETSGGSTNTGVIAGALVMEPTAGIYNEDGTYTISAIGDPKDNPYAVANEYVNESFNDQFQGNGYVEWTILKDLVFKTTFGAQIYNGRRGTYSPTTLIAGRNVGGDADIHASKTTMLLSENYLSYNKEFSDSHRINLMAGYSYQSYRNEAWTAASNQYITDTYLYWNIDGGADYQQPSSSLTEWEMLSYYGRANYNFKNKYLFTVTGRYDGSSRFGANNKWAFFPSGAFAWNIKQEPFLQSFDELSHLKFRASYGVTGNSEIGIYQSLANFASALAIIGEQTVNAVRPSTVANANLSWESTRQTDIGLDFGFFDERIIFTADYYYKKTVDLLYQVPLPEYSSYNSVMRNIGSMDNKGFEFGINTVNVNTKNVNWTTDFNISFNKGKVLSLPAGEMIYSRRPGHIIGDDTHILTEGSPAGSFYGYIYDGVNPEDGSPIYRDFASRDADNNLIMEPDGIVNSNDRAIIGNPHPDFIYGMNNTISYKNFDLNFFFQGVQGNDMLSFTRMELEWVNGKVNQMATVLDRWTPTNTNTDIPKASGTYSSIASSRWIEDGSYLRLKNLSLGYNIPGEVLGKMKIDRLRVYLSAQNLLTITNYSGYNPDVSYRDGNTSLGLDYGSYPGTKSVTLGLNLIF